MNKILSSFAVLTIMVFSISLVSAVVPICATAETTYVSGTITDLNTGNPVFGAEVEVTCNGIVKTGTSDSNGGYSVQYLASECDDGDEVSVSATYGSLSGTNNDVTWYSENTKIGCLELIVNVACANVPLIPEFGMIIGTLTVISAIGVFFFVRRK